jgi:hypothetical protein
MSNARKIVGEMVKKQKGKKISMGNAMEQENAVFDRILIDPEYEKDGKRRAIARARRRAAKMDK